MSRLKQLSEPTVARLPVYQRIANEMLRRGITQSDSNRLGELAGVTSATVRRDLAGLALAGVRGAGYDLAALVAHIEATLGADRQYDVVIVGMGNLGRALANSRHFLISGARLVGLYDASPDVIGSTFAGLEVQDSANGFAEASMGVICVPPESAQAAADALVAANIHAILNFAPQVLEVPLGTMVRYVDFSVELQLLAYHLTNGTGPLGGGLMRTLGLTAPPRAPRAS